jgi:hydrogenase large subunit
VDAWATGTLFRGFEKILEGRAPEDAEHITQRICGVCPVAHGLSAVLALENAYKLTIPNNALVMRNLVNAANFIQSHILHFYHLAAPDFINGPAMPPWQPSWNIDRRLDANTTATLVNHYVQAIDMTRQAHQLGALFGGRMPAPPAYVAGGFACDVTAARIAAAKTLLATLTPFITNVYLPDVAALAGAYGPAGSGRDWSKIGRGYGNLLAYGVFDLNAAGTTKLLKRGRVVNGATTVATVNLAAIKEQVTNSWYQDSTNGLGPAAGQTVPQYPKANAYSWLKAPRLARLPYEAGALARMWVNGDYRQGISVLDRHAARAAETLKIATAARTWLDQLVVGGPVWNSYSPPAAATGVGLTEAPRGAIGHWVATSGGKISRYQIITPTCWNASPRDTVGKRGPIEQALIGTPVTDINQPTEVVRVIHSFDPCLSCAVHVMHAEEGAKIFRLGHYHTADEAAAGHDHDHDEHGHSHDEAHDHVH